MGREDTGIEDVGRSQLWVLALSSSIPSTSHQSLHVPPLSSSSCLSRASDAPVSRPPPFTSQIVAPLPFLSRHTNRVVIHRHLRLLRSSRDAPICSGPAPREIHLLGSPSPRNARSDPDQTTQTRQGLANCPACARTSMAELSALRSCAIRPSLRPCRDGRCDYTFKLGSRRDGIDA